MKKFIFSLGLISMLAVAPHLVASCSSDEEPTYSCNTTVDAWVKKNKKKIQSMDRRSWKNLGQDVSKAAYLAFTQKQKISFWCEKINEVKSLGWNEEEQHHLEQVKDYVLKHKYIFADTYELSESDQDEMDLFFYKWKKYAIEHFGWSESLCYAIVASGQELADREGRLVTVRTRSGGVSTGPTNPGLNLGDCHCSVESDYCGFPINPSVECYRGFCNKVSGCGTLWAKECNGRCSRM